MNMSYSKHKVSKSKRNRYVYTGSFMYDILFNFNRFVLIIYILYIYVLYMYKYASEICVYVLTEVPDPTMASSQDV